ncbi:hypothetical protein [Vibrio cortegadensis]|uniref:hypothetical protein n=1 Tax=Vibrio cortegadensis TaxID=1328770 RepID=UPI00352CA250
MKSAEYIRQELKDQKITQPQFAKQYYLDEVDEKASEQQLYDHCERFKSLLKIPDSPSPERITAYINYFDRRYKKENRFTQADRAAAWEMFIELDTRIATRNLDDGDSKSALVSLAALFNVHRENSKRHGPNSRQYYHLVTDGFEDYLRPFTSKWHSTLKGDNEVQFREELQILQSKLNSLKVALDDMAN